MQYLQIKQHTKHHTLKQLVYTQKHASVIIHLWYKVEKAQPPQRNTL